MDCREIFESLSEYIDEALAAKTCKEIEAHLAGCDNCRVVVNTLRHTVTLYHEIPAKTVPGDVRLRLHKRIMMERQEDSGD